MIRLRIGIISDVISEMTFIQLYCSFINSCQRYARKDTGKSDLLLPFAIMTSGDTHQHTVELMAKNAAWTLMHLVGKIKGMDCWRCLGMRFTDFHRQSLQIIYCSSAINGRIVSHFCRSDALLPRNSLGSIQHRKLSCIWTCFWM